MSNRDFYQNLYNDKNKLANERDLLIGDSTTGFFSSGFFGSLGRTAVYTYKYDDEMNLFRNSLNYERDLLSDTIKDENDKTRFLRAHDIIKQNQERGQLLDSMNDSGEPIEKSSLSKISSVVDSAADSVVKSVGFNGLIQKAADKIFNENDMSVEEAGRTLQELREKYDSPFKNNDDVISHMRQTNQEQSEILQETIDQAPIRGTLGSFVGGIISDPILAATRAGQDGEYVHLMSYAPVGLPLKGLSMGAKALTRASSGFALNAGTEAYLQYEYIQDFQNIVLENDEYGQKDIMSNILIGGVAGAAISGGLPYAIERIRQPRLINDAKNTIDNILNIEGAKAQQFAETEFNNERKSVIADTINKEKDKVSTFYKDGVVGLRAEQSRANENLTIDKNDIDIDDRRAEYYIAESKTIVSKNQRSDKYTKQLNKNTELKDSINKKRIRAKTNLYKINNKAIDLKNRISNIDLELNRSNFEIEFKKAKEDIENIEKEIKNSLPEIKRTANEFIQDMNMLKNTFEIQGKRDGLKGKKLNNYINIQMREKFGIDGEASAVNIKRVANERSREINNKIENFYLNEVENARSELQIKKLDKLEKEVSGVYSKYRTDGDLRENLNEIDIENSEVKSFSDRLIDEQDLKKIKDKIMRNYSVAEKPDPSILNALSNSVHQSKLSDNIKYVKTDKETLDFEIMKQNEMVVRVIDDNAGDVEKINDSLLKEGFKKYMSNILSNKNKINEIQDLYSMNERKFFLKYRDEINGLFEKGLNYKQIKSIINDRINEYNNSVMDQSATQKIQERFNKGLDNKVNSNIETNGLTDEEKTTLETYEKIINSNDESKLRLFKDNKFEFEAEDGTKSMKDIKDINDSLKTERKSLADILTCML